MARRSGTECAAIFDACRVLKLADEHRLSDGRELLVRVVAMPTAMVLRLKKQKSGSGSGSGSGYLQIPGHLSDEEQPTGPRQPLVLGARNRSIAGSRQSPEADLELDRDRQVRSEVWISIVHGSMGIGYFVHQFEPSFVEAALLANDTMKTAVAEINARITELAPVLNTQSVSGAVTVTPDDDGIPIDTMVKRFGDATYLFAVSMRAGTTSATFDVTCLPGSATATVLDESRSIPVSNGRFSDQFTDYQAHLYRIE